MHVVILVKKNKTDREFSGLMEDEQGIRNFSKLTLMEAVCVKLNPGLP